MWFLLLLTSRIPPPLSQLKCVVQILCQTLTVDPTWYCTGGPASVLDELTVQWGWEGRRERPLRGRSNGRAISIIGSVGAQKPESKQGGLLRGGSI